MAHNLNYNSKTEKHSFFSVKEKAWHGLGQIITDYPTSAEAIKHAGLDYAVEKRNLFTYGDDTTPETEDNDIVMEWRVDVPNHYATVRTDTDEVLGVVGKDYNIVQNIDAFAFFDSIVGSKDGVLYETAGALGKGERIFITAKLPDFIRVGRTDCIEKYLFLTSSHDGFGSITASFTPIRVCCQNTLNAALKNHTNSIKIRHTASAQEKLKQAHQLLGITNQLANELEEVFNYWAGVKITDRQVKRLVQLAMAPNKETLNNLKINKQDELSSAYINLVDSVLEYAQTSPTQQDVSTKGTVFGAYNAVTGYFQNIRNYKDDESKFKSIMYGTGLQRSQTAFDLCSSFAKNGVEALN